MKKKNVNEVVSETNEATNENEKKNVKVVINQFIEKHGKKKCIIVGSICGAVILALILGLSIGLSNKKAPIVSAIKWKERATEIANKHEGDDSDYKAPTKVTVSFKHNESTSYSDGVVENEYTYATYAIDNDKLMIYGKSHDGSGVTGSEDRISYHEQASYAHEIYDHNTEFCFWIEEKEKVAYMVATQDSVTKSYALPLTDDDITQAKADPEYLETLSEDCQKAFDKAIGDDETIKNYDWAVPSATIGYIAYLFPPMNLYDKYYEDFEDDGVAYIDGAKYAANYTKKKLELRSSGKGNVSFAFSGVTDEDIEDYNPEKVDEVTHIKGDCSYALSYDKYNMTNYDINRNVKVNLTNDLTADLAYQLSYKINYKASIKKPEVKNLIKIYN